MWRLLFVALLGLAGCQQLPPSPADIQAKKFETVPNKSVIYLVREHPDLSYEPTSLTLDDALLITTHSGTYYRWEVDPGPHRIDGYTGDMGRISLNTEPGRLYFVRQSVSSFFRFPQSQFALIPEPHGRTAVLRAVPVGGE